MRRGCLKKCPIRTFMIPELVLRRLMTLVLLLTTLYGCGGQIAQPTPIGNAASVSDAGAFTVELMSITGVEWSSATVRGKPLLVLFFSSWCERCFLSLRQLNAMISESEFKGQFEVAGVLIDEQNHKAVAQELTVGVPVVFPVLRSNAQLRASMKQHLKITGVPAACLLDASGHIVESFEGSPPVAYLARRAMNSGEESE